VRFIAHVIVLSLQHLRRHLLHCAIVILFCILLDSLLSCSSSEVEKERLVVAVMRKMMLAIAHFGIAVDAVVVAVVVAVAAVDFDDESAAVATVLRNAALFRVQC
jgi:hypothetical protein